MKTYIHKPIVIRKPATEPDRDIPYSIEAWKEFIERMRDFGARFCIFNQETEPGVLVISQQKINLDEEDMCEFLYYFENILYDEFDMLLVKRFTIEFERICLSIEAIFAI